VRPRAHVLFLSGADFASASAPALVCSELPPSLRAGAYFLLTSCFGAE
jgi:hypothetical protein